MDILATLFHLRLQEMENTSRNNRMKIFVKYTLLFSLLFCPILPQVFATERSTPLVPITDRVYDDLDILISHKLINDVVVGQRPYTQSEVRRLIDQANNNFSANNSNHATGFVKSILEKLNERFPENKEKFIIHPLESVSLNTLFLDSPSRPYFQPSQLNGIYNPLAQQNGGRHFIDGNQYAWETSHSALLGKYFSTAFIPRFQLQIVNDQNQQENGVFIQELYFSTYFHNTQIDIGRRPMIWGQGRLGGFMFANNARPSDGLTLFNPSPWKIKFLGNLKYTFFLSTLGPEQMYKNDLMSGIKFNFMPAKWFEFGFGRAIIFGGENGPYRSFPVQVGEFFGARPAGGDDGNFSNSISNLEFRLKIPPLRNTEVYGQADFDDVNFRFPFRTLIQDTGLLAGIFIPRLNDEGSINLRIEMKRTSCILYGHSTWRDGWTLNQFTLGDPLGPDADSYSTTLTRIFSKTILTNQFVFERIDTDTYSGGAKGRVRQSNGNSEKRIRHVAGINYQYSPWFLISANAGYERVIGFNFINDDNRNNFLLGVGLTLNTDKRTTVKK